MRAHDPRLGEIDCAEARRDLSLLVDCECDDACRSRLEHHLAGCPECRELVMAQRRLKERLSQSCCEKAPVELRQRLMIQIRRTTVTTTDAEGNRTVRQTTTVERRFRED